jgi:hypothetical protein
VSEFKLTTPVAFIIFNRPDTTARVFAEIARARPPKLLVVGDGPRATRLGEAERVAATRAIIEAVDWPCEVLTNFSEANLGCKNRVSSGIDWIFEQVEEAIILEDDCLPDPSFFRFCQEMLERYRQDQRIGMISGDNFQFGHRSSADSYYFSRCVHIWGWATWRDRWKGQYDAEMKTWADRRQAGWLEDVMLSDDEVAHWTKTFDKVAAGGIDTWDFQWVYTNWIGGRLSVLPHVNLISNIGFGTDATHTTGNSEVANLPAKAMEFSLRHPIAITADARADRRTFERLFMSPSLFRRIVRRLSSLIQVLKASSVS